MGGIASRWYYVSSQASRLPSLTIDLQVDPAMTANRPRLPLELLYTIVHLVPASDLQPLLYSSSALRRETQRLLYRDIDLSTRTPGDIRKVALMVPYIGCLVRSFTIGEVVESDNTSILAILDLTLNLTDLNIQRKGGHYRIETDFIPTHPCFRLKSFRLWGLIRPSTLRSFLQTQRETLVHLEAQALGHALNSGFAFTLPQLRVFKTRNSFLLQTVLEQNTVVCIDGHIPVSTAPGETFPSIKAIKCRSFRRIFSALPALFPNLRFLEFFVVSTLSPSP